MELVSSVNGIPLITPTLPFQQADSEGVNPQDMLNARFLGEAATERGQLFMTPDQHKEQIKQDSGGGSRLFGVPDSPLFESKIQNQANPQEQTEPVTGEKGPEVKPAPLNKLRPSASYDNK